MRFIRPDVQAFLDRVKAAAGPTVSQLGPEASRPMYKAMPPVTGLVLAGDSTGGNLAAACAQELTGKLPLPVLAQWLIYPSVDFLSQTPSLTEFAQSCLLSR